MEIVVLDAKPLDAGDVSWDGLQDLGHVTLHPQTRPSEVVKRIEGAQVVLTNKVRLVVEDLEQASSLQYIGVLATGYDVVDVDAAKDRNMTVTNVPGYSTPSTAQATMALLLELTQGAGKHDAAVRNGRWRDEGTFSFWERPLIELENRIMFIVGLGAIGARVAQMATAFGMKVYAAKREGQASATGSTPRIELDEGLAMADVVSLHCPLTPKTTPLMDARRLACMKDDAILLNTSRGKLVDSIAVAKALHEGKLGGYAADVLDAEPPPNDHVLFSAPRCILTPHIAWATQESRQRLINMTVSNLQAFLSGHPVHVVS
jgi:glycerate dehydrogenase